MWYFKLHLNPETCFFPFAARLFPSCRLTLGIMGLFGGIVINLMRNNLSVGIVCMTVDATESDANVTNGTDTFYRKSIVSKLFPNYRRSRQKFTTNNDFENCPNEVSCGAGYGEVLVKRIHKFCDVQIYLSTKYLQMIFYGNVYFESSKMSPQTAQNSLPNSSNRFLTNTKKTRILFIFV